MSVKPILMNTEMVRAILDGRKTVTRRVVKPQPGEELAYIWGKWSYSPYNKSRYEEHKTANDWKYWTPPFHTDDVLWVRETFRVDYLSNIVGSGRVHYKADGTFGDLHFQPARYDMMRRAQLKPGWRPNENMPKEAARIFLRVTGVRVERLHAISYEDLQREGGKSDFYKVKRCRACGYGEPHYPECDYEHCDYYERLWEESFLLPFIDLWDSTIKHADLDRYGWDANPWVWVIEFERCDAPPQWGVQSATRQRPALNAEQKPEEA